MRRANIRQIEQQSEEVNKLSEKEIDDFIKKNSEPKTFKRNSKEYKEETLSNDLTFEEMVSINKKNQEKQKNTKDKKEMPLNPQHLIQEMVMIIRQHMVQMILVLVLR